MKNIITILFATVVCCFLSNITMAQGTLGEYPGAGVGYDSGCGYPDAGNSDPGVADATLAGNTCGSPIDATFGPWAETAGGFDITGYELNNFDIDTEAAYGIRLFYGPQNNCCTICLDAMLDLSQGAACGTFGPQVDLGAFGIPVPANYGVDIFGVEIIPYADMCPNTEYFAQYQFILATAVDLTDPDGNFCAMDDALITNAGTQTTVQTLVAPGTRDPIAINSTTLALVGAADCGSTDVVLDFTADIVAGCTVSFGTCSQGLEFEFRAALVCADGAALDITTGPLVNDPTGCYTGAALTGQISLGSAADVCAILECDPAASLELYTTYTFCETDDINGDGTGNDEAVMSVSVAAILAAFDAATCCNVVAACPEFNAITYGPICNGYDICIGYLDTDQDGIGDAGEDPTGIMMTVTDGLATSVAQAPINDGIFLFDADGDMVNDAIGYCYTVLFDNPTCDPEPYTPLVTLTCADGTEAMLLGGIPLTDWDILAGAFGIAGGTAIYPPLGGFITAAACPDAAGAGGAAAIAEIFVVDAAGAPVGAACATVTGAVPAACDDVNTTDVAVPLEWNPTNDPLFTALAGPDSFSCGFTAPADLSFTCDNCVASACPEFNAQTFGPICSGYDICIGYIDTDQDGIGDAGEDPTGIMMTVTDGIATSVAQAPINDGVFFFDADGDGVSDAVGYCYTVLFDNPTCDPEPYTPLVTLTCADGSEAMLLGGVPLTDYDILANTFGIPGGTAIYPPLVGIITSPVCPALVDESDAVAGNVEVFIADANGDPTATSCLVVPGEVPACETAGGDPAAVVQWNPTNDPLFTALAGPDSYSCGLNATADLSFDCPVCGVDPPAECAGDPDYTAPTEVCSSVDGAGNYTLTPGAGCTNPESTAFPGDDRYDYFITLYIDPATGAPGPAPAGYDPIIATNTFNVDLADVLGATVGSLIGFANGTQCATDVGLVLTNPACETATFSFFIVPVDYDSDLDGDTYFGDVLDDADPNYCPPVRLDVDVYPNLTATVVDDGSTCGTAQIDLLAEDGVTVCESQTLTCVANGDVLDADFSGTFADPAGCSTLTASATCANCGDDPIPCEITTAITSIECDDMGTPEDGTDDTEVVTVTITSTGPWTAGDGTMGVSGDTYVFPATLTGGTVMMMFSVDGEDDCSAVFTYIVIGCDTPAIPTLSQWGLMILALLMMTFGALKIGSVSLSSVRRRS